MTERLKDSLFAGIVSIAADAIISTDEEHRILVFNAGAEHIFGYTAAEVLGQPLDILLPHRFRAAHDEHMRRFAASDVSARRMGERQKIAGLRKNGEEFPAEASILKLRTPDLTLFTVMLRDVTSQRRAEDRQRFLAHAGEMLAHSLEYARTIEQVVRLPIPILGRGCIVDVVRDGKAVGSAAAHEDAELSQIIREMRRRYPVDLGSEHPVARVVRTRAPLVLSGAEVAAMVARLPEAHRALVERLEIAGAMFIPLVARDTPIGVMSFYGSSAYDADDLALALDTARLAGLSLDNARLHEQIQQALRARDEMVAIVSHDLRNPVQAVKMLTAAAAHDEWVPSTPAESRENLLYIRRAAEQMDELIQALLDVTRIEAGRFRVAPRSSHPAELVRVALETLEPIAADRAILLERFLDGDLPPVAADVSRITQVFSNLIGNSLKFTPPGGRIGVRARTGDDAVVFAVTDTGEGVPPDQLPYVFDRYWQSRRTGRAGAGLGLPIAKGIVEAHGGRMWIESTVGEGTTAYFTLPTSNGTEDGA